MRRYLKALPLLGALLAACSSPSPVDEIVTSNLAARGGKERLQALQSIRETGTATASGGRVARVVREIKRPGLFRLEFSSQGTTSVFAHDGETGWRVAPLQGQFEPQVTTPEADVAGGGVDQRDLEGSLVDWREKGHLVELVGRETLPGGEAFKLKLTLKDGAIRYDYVDVASHQIVRSDITRTIRGAPCSWKTHSRTSGKRAGSSSRTSSRPTSRTGPRFSGSPSKKSSSTPTSTTRGSGFPGSASAPPARPGH